MEFRNKAGFGEVVGNVANLLADNPEAADSQAKQRTKRSFKLPTKDSELRPGKDEDNT